MSMFLPLGFVSVFPYLLFCKIMNKASVLYMESNHDGRWKSIA